MSGLGPVAAGPPVIAACHRRVLLPVLGVVVLAVFALVALGFIHSNIGGAAVLVGAMVAVLPVLPVVAAFLWVDRWEPEPPPLLLAAFLWGAGLSVLGAAIVNDAATVLGEQVLGTGGGDLAGAVISAPVVEEGFKGAFLVGLLWLRRRELDGVVDGIVYAGVVAAGFAFTENILYFGRAFVIDGLAGASGSVVTVFMMRGVLSPFAHPVFTAMIGIAVGLAVRRPNPRNLAAWVLLPFAGYLAAVALHALWNASAGLGLLPAFYGAIMVPLFGGLIVLVVWQRRREQRVISAALPGFASAGWIAPSEVPLLASQVGRRGWCSEVRRRSGEAAAEAVRDYQHAVTELAFVTDRMHRAAGDPDIGRWHHEALAALVAARDRATGIPGSISGRISGRIQQHCRGEAAHLDRRGRLRRS